MEKRVRGVGSIYIHSERVKNVNSEKLVDRKRRVVKCKLCFK